MLMCLLTLSQSEFGTSELFSLALFAFPHHLYHCRCCGHGSSDVMRIVSMSGEWQPCSQFKSCRAPGMGAHAQSVFQCRAGHAVLLLDD